MEELYWPAQSPDHNPIQQLWDGLLTSVTLLWLISSKYNPVSLGIQSISDQSATHNLHWMPTFRDEAWSSVYKCSYAERMCGECLCRASGLYARNWNSSPVTDLKLPFGYELSYSIIYIVESKNFKNIGIWHDIFLYSDPISNCTFWQPSCWNQSLVERWRSEL